MLDYRVATFLCVCETMNFTKAAQALSLTQPAITQHIHVLEKYYGVRLFHYENRTLSLTREGKLLRDRLSSMMQDEHRIRGELHASPGGHRLLRFGVTRTIGEYAALSPLCAYLDAHPDCNLLLRYGNTEELLALLDAGELSLALIEGNFPREKYGTKKYRTEDFCAVCSANHHFIAETVREVRDLLPERLLIREPGSGTRNILEQSLSALGLTTADFPSFLQVENMHTLIWESPFSTGSLPWKASEMVPSGKSPSPTSGSAMTLPSCGTNTAFTRKRSKRLPTPSEGLGFVSHSFVPP